MQTHWIHTASTLLILSFLLSSCQVHGLFSSIFSGDGEKSGGVEVLTEERFEEVLKKGEDVFVVLFLLPGEDTVSPYDGTKCMLQTASKALKKGRVIFGVADTKAVARREGVTETGLIQIYKSGQKVIYQGQSSGQSLAAFVSKMLQPAVKLLTDDDDEDEDELDDLVEDLRGDIDLPTAIGYFNSTSTEYEKYKNAAVRLQAFVRFYAILNKKTAKTVGLTTEGSVHIYQPYRRTPVLLNIKQSSSDKDIDNFISKHRHYVLHKLDPSETQKFQAVKKGSTQLFTFLDTDHSVGRSFFTIFRRVVKQLSKGEWNINPILWIEPDNFSMLIEDIKDEYDINWKLPVVLVISGENTRGSWLDMSVLNKLPCEASRYMALYSWIESAATGGYSNKYRNTGLTTQPLPQSQIDFMCTFPFENDDWDENIDDDELALPNDEESAKKKAQYIKSEQDKRTMTKTTLDYAKDFEIGKDRKTENEEDDDDDDMIDSWKEKEGRKKGLRSKGHGGGDDPDFPGDDGGDGDTGGLKDPDEHHMGTLFAGQPENNDDGGYDDDGDDDNADDNVDGHQHEDSMEYEHDAEGGGSSDPQSQDHNLENMDRVHESGQSESNLEIDRYFNDDDSDDYVQLLSDDNDDADLEKSTMTLEPHVEDEMKESNALHSKVPSDKTENKSQKIPTLFDDDDDADSVVDILPDEGPSNDFWLQYESNEDVKPVEKKEIKKVIERSDDIHDEVEKAGMGEAIDDDFKQEPATLKQEEGKIKQEQEIMKREQEIMEKEHETTKKEQETTKKEQEIHKHEAEGEKQDNVDDLSSWDFLKEKEDEKSIIKDIKGEESSDEVVTTIDLRIVEEERDQSDMPSAEPIITVSDDYDLNATEEKKESAKKSIKFRPAPVYKFPNQPNYESEDMYEILCGNFLNGQVYPECSLKQRRKDLKQAIGITNTEKIEN